MQERAACGSIAGEDAMARALPRQRGLTSCMKYRGRRHVSAAANKLKAAWADGIPLPMICMRI